MEDERMSLFDVSIQDNDVIALGDVVYKVGKIRSVWEHLTNAMSITTYW